MGKKVEMIGRRFGRLIVLDEDKRDPHGIIYYKCQCDCGTEKIIKGTSLRAGVTVSCGCYNKEVITKENPNYKMRLYYVYQSIKDRCNNPNNKAFHNYGGRGIKVADEWNSFDNFKEWAYSHGYKTGLWIERIDNNKDYSPENCRWATVKEQQNNKRVCRFITINGITQTVTQWAEVTGIKRATIYRRLQLGWPESEILRPTDTTKSHGQEIKAALASRGVT